MRIALMKRSKLAEDLLNTELPNYSQVLTTAYSKKGPDFVVYLYKLRNLARFAVVLPVVLMPHPTHLVENYSRVLLAPDELETLKAFQVALWRELFKVKEAEGGSSDTCNYLVVPHKDGAIDNDLVTAALSPPTEAADALLRGKFVHSKQNPNILWEVLQVVDKHTPATEFLQVFLASCSELESICERYADKSAFEMVLDPSASQQAFVCVRSLILKNQLNTCDKQALLLKQVPSVRNFKSKPKSTDSLEPPKPSNPNGTPILLLDSVTMSFLDEQLMQDSHALLQTLIDLEAFSYVCEFYSEFGFKGEDFKGIYSALRSSSLDATHNYESLETLGDTVLKFLTSLHHFLIYTKDNEGWLTRKRTYIINNQFLSKIGLKLGIQKYLKTRTMLVSRWKPPYFRSPELVFKTTVVHRISEGMIADTVEALIGAYYVGKGLLHAVEFIDRIELIKKGADWTAVKSYCDYNSFELLTPDKLPQILPSKRVTLEELISRPEVTFLTGQSTNISRLLKRLNYKAKDMRLFRAAFTHSSVDMNCNYERLEFLGDALIDLVILSNIYTSSATPIHPHTMTLMHHALVNNNILAFYSLSLQLQSYMIGTPEVNVFIDNFLADLKWEDDLLNFGVHCQDPPKYLADLFESLAAAILIDTGSVSVACRVVQLVMAKPMAYLALNKSLCQSNIVTRAKEFIQKRGGRLLFKTLCVGDEVTVVATVGERELSRHTALTRWLAERFAANKAYHILVSE